MPGEGFLVVFGPFDEVGFFMVVSDEGDTFPAAESAFLHGRQATENAVMQGCAVGLWVVFGGV
jgi:hypothetical protein